MPIYEYLEDGHIVERILSVEERDKFPNRVTAPRRVKVCPRGRPSQEMDVMRGLYQVEQQLGTAGFRKRFPFTIEQTRKAWGKNRATDNFSSH